MRILSLITVMLMLSTAIYMCASDDTQPVEEIHPVVHISVAEQFKADVEAMDDPTVCAPYECLSLDDELQIYLEQRCADYGLDFWIMASLMFSESSFRIDAIGDSGKSIGLMQINQVNWIRMEEDFGLDPFEIHDNIECGLIIFDELMDKHDGDYELALQCYKCGNARGTELWNEGIVLQSIEGILERAEKWKAP